MVDLTEIKEIYLYPSPIDFRKGMGSLTNIILTEFKEADIIDCLFVFFGNDKRQIKMIEVNDDGTWLYQKKLREGNFIFPTIDDCIKIDRRQLITILSTIKRKKVKEYC